MDDEALSEFHTHYFRKLNLYKDGAWKIYKAMGGRKINPAQLIMGLARSFKRHKKKKIETRMGPGDGWMLGGVLIFDQEGELIYAYQEEYGLELDMNQIENIISSARDETSRHNDMSEVSSSFDDSISS